MLAAAALPGAGELDPIPVLVVSGANNHDWEFSAPSLVAMLEASGRFAVQHTNDPATSLAQADYLAGFQAVVLDYNGPRWGEAAEANFVAAVEGGLGVAVIHAANNAFDGWVEYEHMVALMWRAGTGHGSFHSFDVTIEDRDHPITRGLPDLVAHPDELYHRLVHMHDTDYHVLASAHSSSESGGSGNAEPMVIVKQYGQGRIFHTPLGHVWRGNEPSRASHADPQFQNLVARAVEWAATGRVTDGASLPNSLSSLERATGWRLLFDGESTDGWRAMGGGAFPEAGWEVVDGCLVHRRGGGGGDIVYGEQFGDFELELEWKVTPGANSGIKYRVPEREGQRSMFGHEYQVLDDSGHRDGGNPKTSAGAAYAIYPTEGKLLARTGAFNHTRIVARGRSIEHWLNGVRVLAFEIESEDWLAHVAQSKFRGSADFGRAARGLIGLQDHGDEVWYRSIKLRALDAMPVEATSLLPGDDLAGWTMVGEALYSVEDEAIVGVSGPRGRHTFLTSDQTYGDFVLEVDVRLTDRGNSGIQVRSALKPNGGVHGYQIEIDPSARAWSAGLYDEGRRGWLDDLNDTPAARAAFTYGEWNRYRIECVGPWIRTWINGQPAADHFDPLDLQGFIGFQVHGGNNTHVEWGRPTLWDLGRREWVALGDMPRLEHAGTGSALGATPRVAQRLLSELGDGALRFALTASGGFGFVLEAPGAAPEARAGAAQVSPGRWVWGEGWLLDVNAAGLARWNASGANECAISVYGDRMALHVGDRLALDRVGLPRPAGAVLRLELWDAGSLQLENLRTLSEAR